jgi:hypothetical protein
VDAVGGWAGRGVVDELLPVEVRELPEDLAVLDRLLADPQLPAPIEPAWAQRGRWHGRRGPPLSGLIPLACNEAQHLSAVQVARPVGDHGHRLRWSVWRRRHQARIRTCHDRPQASWQPSRSRSTAGVLTPAFQVAPCLRSRAGQWRRDPVTVLRALATLTRMARDDGAGGEARGRRVEQSA